MRKKPAAKKRNFDSHTRSSRPEKRTPATFITHDHEITLDILKCTEEPEVRLIAVK